MSADILQEIDSILAENAKRWEKLQADYNPVTGEGLAELLGEKRVKLEISDFAIPVQWVPEEMMANKLVKQVAKAGSIEKYIATKKWKLRIPTFHEIEIRLRRIRHKYDFCHWAFFCIRITAKVGGRIRFKLNYPQLIVLKQCEELRRKGEPIDIIILKARQWGGSTFCIFYQTWIAFKWDEFHSFVVAAHVGSAAETILSMLKDAIRDYPAWDLGLPDDTEMKLSRRGTTNNAWVLKDSADNQLRPTVIYIGSAERPETLRSSAIHGIHSSEVGIWPDTPEKRPEALIADIVGGMTKVALDMQVMESTAKSSDDYFHEVWTTAIKGESSYKPIFIPWFYIPHDTKSVKDQRKFVKWLLEHKDSEVTEGRWKDAGKHYWWLWEQGATLEGINWYRYKRLDFTTYFQMANEAPSNSVEAFQSAGRKAFDFYDVEKMRKNNCDPIYEGDLISDAKEGPEVLNNIHFIPRQGGTLKIWEMPDDSPISDRYVIAVDIGGPNPTSDWSAVRVLDRLFMMPEFGLDGKPNIVAEMHYHTDHDSLAYDAMRLAAWYNNALLVIESNTLEMQNRERDTGGDGAPYILDLVADIYPNLYMRHNKSEDVADKTTGRWGFNTNGYTKPLIVDHMRFCLSKDKWVEKSAICCDELGEYTQHDGNKFDAPAKHHDDTCVATMILLWVAFKEMEIPKWISTNEVVYDSIESDSNIAML